MTAKIFIKESGVLRVEGHVTTNNDAVFGDCVGVTLGCDGSYVENLPSVFIDSSVFHLFDKVEITGGLSLENTENDKGI